MADWVDMYNNGHRGLVCLMIDVDDIQNVYQNLLSMGLNLSTPEYLKFKWGFGLFTRTMPWMNCYLPFFQCVPFQIGLQQMKDQKSENLMCQYMIPNSAEHGISGIKEIVITGAYSEDDFRIISMIFTNAIISNNEAKVVLDKDQTIRFVRNNEFSVEVSTRCNNDLYLGKQTKIENTIIVNRGDQL